MTTGSVIQGSPGAYGTGTWRTWSGSDDPEHKAWNSYHSSGGQTLNSPNVNPVGIGLYSYPSIWTDDDELRLLDKLSSKVRGHEFNAAVFLGQAREVERSVVGTATAFIGIKKALKRGDLDGAMRFLARGVSGADRKAAKKRLDSRDLAGTHLSLVYGWVPLIHDCFAAAEALEVLAGPPRSTRVVVSRQVRCSYEGSQSPTLYSCPGTYSISKRITYEMTEYLPAARSLGLMSPSEVAWELMPYSFVVDWFVPIGTYLSALAVVPHLKGTFYRQTKETSRIAGCVILPDGLANYSGSNARGVVKTFTRHEAASSLSVPLPKFRGIDQLWSSGARVANAIALMRNLF